MINREYVAEPSPVHHNDIPRQSISSRQEDDTRSDGSLGGLLADAARDKPSTPERDNHEPSGYDASPSPSPVSKYDRGPRSHRDYDKRKSREEEEEARYDNRESSDIEESFGDMSPKQEASPSRYEERGSSRYDEADRYDAPSPRPEDSTRAEFPVRRDDDDDRDELSGRLHKLLEETESEKSTPAGKGGKYSVHRDKHGRSISRTSTGLPTTSPPPLQLSPN